LNLVFYFGRIRVSLKETKVVYKLDLRELVVGEN